MLDLQPCVHFEEEKIIPRKQELNRPCSYIIHRFGYLHSRYTHSFTEFLAKTHSRGFFNNFLVAALHRAITLT